MTRLFIRTSACPLILLTLLTLVCQTTPVHAQPDESYPVHPDAAIAPDVPRGKVIARTWNDSKVYPGTERDYFLYVPAQYDPSSPAAVMVFQDGEKYVRENSSWALPTVFDNLINRGEMPVTIAICVNPGVVSGGDDDSRHRFNRSYEYDSINDRYATFLVDEILPDVAKDYSLTSDPNRRGIGGSSSGAIAAFNVAWHRPDQFRRVFSTVGTFVGLRGANEFPTLIRKSEPKPLKVFLQDGSHDLNIYAGDWWNANRTMLSALQWAHYDVTNVWGEGGHNGKHGSAIFADALKWLWKDGEQPIVASVADHPEFGERLIEGESWNRLRGLHQQPSGLTVAPDGGVYFCDASAGNVLKIDGNTTRVVHENLTGASALAFDAVGDIYVARPSDNVVTCIDGDGGRTDVLEGQRVIGLAVTQSGIYFIDEAKHSINFASMSDEGAVGEVSSVTGPVRPNAIVLTPDKRFALVSDVKNRHVWSYRVAEDGRLEHGQPYSYLHTSDDELSTVVTSLAMTDEGELIAATKLGVQVFDQPGRVHAIIDRPMPRGKITGVAMTDGNDAMIYATVGKAVFARRTKMRGWYSWQDAKMPPKPRL